MQNSPRFPSFLSRIFQAGPPRRQIRCVTDKTYTSSLTTDMPASAQRPFGLIRLHGILTVKNAVLHRSITWSRFRKGHGMRFKRAARHRNTLVKQPKLQPLPMRFNTLCQSCHCSQRPDGASPLCSPMDLILSLDCFVLNMHAYLRFIFLSNETFSLDPQKLTSGSASAYPAQMNRWTAQAASLLFLVRYQNHADHHQPSKDCLQALP